MQGYKIILPVICIVFWVSGKVSANKIKAHKFILKAMKKDIPKLLSQFINKNIFPVLIQDEYTELGHFSC